VLGTIGDIASCTSVLPAGNAAATIDFTLKMLASAQGDKVIGRGRVLQAGKTNSVGASDLFVIQNGVETLCATLLASTRNFVTR
jgi:acyl-coenzyme A thioesterase PaaI-like protein